MNRIEALKKDALQKNERLSALLAQGHDTTDAEYKEAGQLRTELRELKGRLEAEKDAGDLNDWLTKPDSPFHFGGKPAKDGEALVTDSDRGTTVEGLKGLTDRQLAAISTSGYRDSFIKMLRVGEKAIYGTTEFKILQEGIDPSGGFLVPEQIMAELIQKKPAPNAIAGKVRRLQTSRDSLTISRVVYAADDIYNSPIRFTQTGEIPSSGSQATYTDPTFGQSRIEVFTQMVNGQLSKDMLEDSIFDVQGYIAEQFRVQADQLMENLIVNGSGAGQMTGLIANPGGKVGNQQQPAVIKMGNPPTGDAFFKLAYAVPPQYEDNLHFAFNKTNSLQNFVLLKDSANRYLFGAGYQDSGIATARPKELVGYPYLLAQLMPNAYLANGSGNTNAYAVVFGDFNGYWMVERVGLSVQVLDQTAAKVNQIELVGRLRFGGQTVEDWKLKIGQVA